MKRLLVLVSGLFFAGCMLGFFWNLNSLNAVDYSTGDTAYWRQLYWYMSHGQRITSIYWDAPAGVDAFTAPVIQSDAIHCHLWTPVLVAQVVGLIPTLSWLYAVNFLLIYGSMLGLGWAIFRHVRGSKDPFDYLVVASVLLIGPWLWAFQYTPSMSFLAVPCTMLSLYGYITGRWWAVSLGLGLAAGVSEDMAMGSVGVGAFIACAGQQQKVRTAACIGALFCCAVAMTDILLIQPAARTGMVMSASSHAALRLAHLFQDGRVFAQLFVPMSILPALCLFKEEYRKVFGLACLAPCLGWVLVLADVPGPAHLSVVFPCLLTAAVVGMAGVRCPRTSHIVVVWLASAVCGLWALRCDAPWEIKQYVKYQPNNPNGEVVSVIRSLPKEARVVACIDACAEAFVSDRPLLWLYPDFAEQADWVVVQKRRTTQRSHHYAEILDASVACLRTNEAFSVVRDDSILLLHRRP